MDEAYWTHTIEPGRTLNRLDQARIVVPYPWVDGEAHELMLITSTGVTFNHAVEVAVETPRPDFRFFGIFALIGIYVGVLPVAIGMMWTPFLRRLGRKWTQSILALTIGLLLFLGVDTIEESLEIAERLPEAVQGIAIVAIGAVLAFLALEGVTRWLTVRTGGNETTTRLAIAFSIAIGIGIHNLGEGLAIGAAYAVGKITLSTFLIVGFTLHNVTEGLGIVAPIARTRPRLLTLVWLGLIAGVPTIAGAWIGGFHLLRRLGHVLPRDRSRGYLPGRLRGGQANGRQCEEGSANHWQLCRHSRRHADHVCHWVDRLAGVAWRDDGLRVNVDGCKRGRNRAAIHASSIVNKVQASYKTGYWWKAGTLSKSLTKDTQDLVYSILHPIFDCDAGAIDPTRLLLELRKIADDAGLVTNPSFSASN